MKTNTSLLIAALIGATLSAPGQAYEITAPPEIVEADNLAVEYAEHVIHFGTHCLHMTLSGYPDAESCGKFRQAAAKMGEYAEISLEWVSQQSESGATTSTNLGNNSSALDEAVEIIGKVIRARQYQ